MNSLPNDNPDRNSPPSLSRLPDAELDRLIGDDCRAIDTALRDRERALEAVAGCEKSAVISAFRLGGRLQEKKLRLNHGEWRPYLEQIGLGERTASSYIRLARQIGSASDLGSSIRATLAALPKRPKEEEEPPAKTKNFVIVHVDPVTGEKLDERPFPGPTYKPNPEFQAKEEARARDEIAAREEFEAEAEAMLEAEREARDERLAIRLADTDGDAVDVLNGKLDAADARHRADVGAVNDERRAAAAERRKNRDVCDTLLAVPRGDGDTGIDDVLAQFFGVARKS